MSKAMGSLKLVSAPAAKRKCGFCERELYPIERWCGCGKRRLAAGLLWLKRDNGGQNAS